MVNLNKVYLDVNDIMELLSYKDVKSYKIISELNSELEEQAYYVIDTREPTEYFCKRYGIKQNLTVQPFLFKEDVKAITGYGKNKIGEVIRNINRELNAAGILTCKSRVSTEMFCKRFHININNLPYHKSRR